LEAVILKNAALPVSFREKLPLQLEDIDELITRDHAYKKKFETLKIKDLLTENGFVTKQEFCRGLNSGVSQLLWGKLDKIRRAQRSGTMRIQGKNPGV
jgi:hypothetical protein